MHLSLRQPATRRRHGCHGLSAVTFLCLLALALPAAGREFSAARFTGIVEQAMRDWQVPGAAVAVIDGGEPIYVGGFGRTGLDDQSPAIDADTYFINASTTKAMVAAGLMILVDEGRLDLDDPVIDTLPELRLSDPALTAQLTVRDLLTHRSGLPSTDFWTFNQGLPLEEQLPLLRAVKPVAPPRYRKIYQNTMYELAGLVIERITGEPWDSFLDRRLWDPIGMGTVATRSALPADRDRVEPVGIFDGQPRPMNHSLGAEISDAAGSAWSSLNDMLRWAQFLLRGGVTDSGERLLSAQAVETLFQPQQLVAPEDYYSTAALTEPNWISYSLGWYQQDFQGRKIDYHTGSLNGAVALIGLDRVAGRAIIVLANLDGAELRHALLWEVMDPRPEAERPDWHSEVLALYRARQDASAQKRGAIAEARLQTPASVAIEAYSGRYRSTRGGLVEVCVDDGALRLDTRVRSYSLAHWHSDVFSLDHEDWASFGYVSFSLTPRGTIEALHAFGMAFHREARDGPASTLPCASAGPGYLAPST